ncbi:MAG: hypothetical protein F6K47_32390 [Symploca sp. SIO2E6]|nr:hypothetical protein [Symploca sp. SIO2E6]
MKKEKFPARLHVLIASNSDQAIVIRRGPSKYTCVLSWDRKKNSFEVSQWLKGRIYERRADISPSGKYWIYFAMNGKWDSETKGSWTAIAKAPWLKAIALFAKGDCWHGGGLFLDDQTYWLNDGYGHEPLFTSSKVTRNKSYQPQNYYGGECLHIYYNRLQREGWMLKHSSKKGKWNSETIFEKKLSHNWLLRKICHDQLGSPKGKGCYWDEHQLLNEHGDIFVKSSWEWAEGFDKSIIFAEGGILYQIFLQSSDKLSEPKLLHDFNEYKFEFRQAPY